ncbi:uncharacterized protein MYCFIDRAFT_215008 [Pseudocercospora fijiensis CIRAD86]|uniref:Uncharacterized protein n=1 Tax=Pseudocercospora fijiensis (strain CIRAD86) TaxID=383855 RepID=M3AZD8_PSEFD|nr:uncharacterized protein MYCFIDRAFT_215008 [Pseudocercospora fijiensis CIRAD86]EME82572.1 hypothetical protein MYCFIDRAFT_215008 [Pseudocercospora fijiensis CIRAD86]
MAGRTLRELVQSLPQELSDHIYEETFTWTRTTKTVTVEFQKDFDHPAPSLLLVNRDIRSRLLYAFFTNSEFLLPPSPSEFAPHHNAVLSFLRHQPSYLQFALRTGTFSRVALQRFYSFARALQARGLIVAWELDADEDDLVDRNWGYEVRFYC